MSILVIINRVCLIFLCKFTFVWIINNILTSAVSPSILIAESYQLSDLCLTIRVNDLLAMSYHQCVTITDLLLVPYHMCLTISVLPPLTYNQCHTIGVSLSMYYYRIITWNKTNNNLLIFLIVYYGNCLRYVCNEIEIIVSFFGFQPVV